MYLAMLDAKAQDIFTKIMHNWADPFKKKDFEAANKIVIAGFQSIQQHKSLSVSVLFPPEISASFSKAVQLRLDFLARLRDAHPWLSEHQSSDARTISEPAAAFIHIYASVASLDEDAQQQFGFKVSQFQKAWKLVSSIIEETALKVISLAIEPCGQALLQVCKRNSKSDINMEAIECMPGLNDAVIIDTMALSLQSFDEVSTYFPNMKIPLVGYDEGVPLELALLAAKILKMLGYFHACKDQGTLLAWQSFSSSTKDLRLGATD